MANQKIFIIEDDIDILYGLSADLGSSDFIIDSSQGEENLDVLIQNLLTFAPHYIILDLILPKLDGFEVLKRIKAEIELADVPVIIFTDLSDQDSRERSLNMGADQYFLKEEFDVFNFSKKIKKIIDNRDSTSYLSLEDDDDDELFLD